MKASIVIIGSKNCKTWRTRVQPIRTASELSVNIVIQSPVRIALYQKLAQKVRELSVLGLSCSDIANSLGVSITTIKCARRENAHYTTFFTYQCLVV